MTECRHEHDVGVGRVHADLRDVLRVSQADLRPRLAGIGRLVDAVARRDVAADLGLARADVDDVGVRGGDGDGTDRRTGDLIVGDRLPGHAAVGGLPETAAGGAEVVLERAPGAARDGDRSAAALRPDAAPPQRAERPGALVDGRAAPAALRENGRLEHEGAGHSDRENGQKVRGCAACHGVTPFEQADENGAQIVLPDLSACRRTERSELRRASGAQ